MTYEIGFGTALNDQGDRLPRRPRRGHRALTGGRLVGVETRRLALDTVRRLNEEKIARAARLEHAAEKVQTSAGRPRGR